MSWFGRESTHDKQVSAANKVLGNLFEKTTQGGADAPLVLRFELPDSRLRYLVFCVSTVQMACAPVMTNPDAVLNDLLHRVVSLAIAQPEVLGSPPGTPQQLASQAGEYVEDYLHRWAAYIDIANGGNASAATGIVCGMLCSTETNEAPTDADAQRLWPLASWIESRLDAMGQAFVNMAD